MDSPRYNSVLVNKTRIIESLEATKTTRKLAIKLQEKWTGLTSNPTAEELVDNVLGRIKEDEEDFEIFVEKLKELGELDQLVANLEKTSKNPYHCRVVHVHVHVHVHVLSLNKLVLRYRLIIHTHVV